MKLNRFNPVFEMHADLGKVPAVVPETDESFSYAELSEDVANELRAAEEQIRTHGRSMTESCLAIGNTLNRTKVINHHGRHTAWVKVQLGMKMRTAQRYMSLADEYAGVKSANLAHLPMQMLEAIAAPSFPEDERLSLKSDLASDAPPDRAAVRHRIEKAKPSKPKTTRVLDPIEATDAPVAPETAEEASQEAASADPAAFPVIEAEQEPETSEAVAEPAQIEPRPPGQIQRDNIGPVLWRAAERLRETGDDVQILAVVALIGEAASSRALFGALRGESVDIEPMEAGETTDPFQG